MPHAEGGLTVWANLGAPVSSQLALAARNHGLVIAAGPRFGIDGVFERFIRIPFSHPADLIDRAVDALDGGLGRCRAHPDAGRRRGARVRRLAVSPAVFLARFHPTGVRFRRTPLGY